MGSRLRSMALGMSRKRRDSAPPIRALSPKRGVSRVDVPEYLPLPSSSLLSPSNSPPFSLSKVSMYHEGDDMPYPQGIVMITSQYVVAGFDMTGSIIPG